MKKILILSDTHRDLNLIDKVVRKEYFDILIHIGDHHDDIEGILLPKNTVTLKVKGNCDFAFEKGERFVDIEGIKAFITHGHYYNVKHSLIKLEHKAEELDADLVLFGHTHIKKDYCTDSGIRMFNPGSLCYYRCYGKPSYGFMEACNGKIVSLEHREV